MRRGGLSILAFLLAGCGSRISQPNIVTPPPVQNSTLPTPQGDVYPASLNGTPSLEIGALISKLMPPAGSGVVSWDLLSNDAIKWQNEAYIQEKPSDPATRVGLARINIEGKSPSILKERKLELGWTITYSGENPKFGVQKIEIDPGKGTGSCFGVEFEGCAFDIPITSLVKAGIHVDIICSMMQGFQERRSAVLLTQSGRRPVVFVLETGYGSGGSSSTITLRLDTESLAKHYGKPSLPESYGDDICHDDQLQDSGAQ